MKLIRILTGMVFVALTSCSTQSMLTSDVPSTKVDKLLIFKPVTSISVVLNGNRPMNDPILSGWSNINLKNGVDSILPKKVTTKKTEFDVATQSMIDDAICQLSRNVEHQNSIRNVKIPSTLDSVMNSLNMDYALCVYQEGFTRTQDNFFNELGKSYYNRLRSYSWNYSFPLKSSSTIIGYIIDRKNKNIALYRRDTRDNWEPVDKNNSDKQLNHIFNRYFSDVD